MVLKFFYINNQLAQQVNLAEERQEIFGLSVENNENFTAKDKRIVRNDWNNYFKSLKRYRDAEISNRLGPLVISIYIKMGRLSSSHIPIYSVHNLCREFPYNTLIASLYLEGELISPQKHNSVYIQEAQELEKKHIYLWQEM